MGILTNRARDTLVPYISNFLTKLDVTCIATATANYPIFCPSSAEIDKNKKGHLHCALLCACRLPARHWAAAHLLHPSCSSSLLPACACCATANPILSGMDRLPCSTILHWVNGTDPLLVDRSTRYKLQLWIYNALSNLCINLIFFNVFNIFFCIVLCSMTCILPLITLQKKITIKYLAFKLWNEVTFTSEWSRWIVELHKISLCLSWDTKIFWWT